MEASDNLALFVHTHEQALANALQLQRQRVKNGTTQSASAPPNTSTTTTSSTTAVSLADALSRPLFSFTTPKLKPAKLTLTPHHLFYLLSKFEDLGVDIGPMTVRLESLHSDPAPSNYVSFLGQAPKSRGRQQSDADSLRSVSSMRSVMSSMSSVWSAMTLSNSATKAEKQMTQYRDDLKYLYSCFTKIPALRLAPDHRARLISGFEEFPFDTAVPLFAFKNVSSLEICDLDFRQFHGWDRLSEQLRSLTVKRGCVEDPIDLLQNIVLDDAEKRRKRSSKVQMPTTPSTPGAPWPSGSPRVKQIDIARSISAPNSPFAELRRSSTGSSSYLQSRAGTSDGKYMGIAPGPLSRSPPRPATSRQGSLHKPYPSRSSTPKFRRSSGSSGSSTHETTPRHSTSDLSLGILPSSKWRFLRHLSLVENALTHLTVTSLAPVANTLQSLDLSGNLFCDIPDALASLTHLRALNLSNCMIDSLQSLSRSPLPAIETLNLRSNRLLSLAGIERLYSLERLDLRDNRLHDPTELARLTGIPNIRDVFVIKNPFTKTHSNYRITVFNLFRSTPGHVDDVTIDTLGPIYSEKRHLVDRVPEPANKPVVKPPPEDEEDATHQPAELPAELHTPSRDETPSRTRHTRSVSDVGSMSTARRRKAPRRRIVELTDRDLPPMDQPSPEPRPVPELTELPPMPHTPNTESDQPTTPEETPYHTAPAQPDTRPSLAARPRLDTAFQSPTPPPKIRESSDDDNSPVNSQDDTPSNFYRQKAEALKHELGPGWLSAFNGERPGEQESRERSFSPASRSSTVRPDQTGRAVNVGGRTLG